MSTRSTLSLLVCVCLPLASVCSSQIETLPGGTAGNGGAGTGGTGAGVNINLDAAAGGSGGSGTSLGSGNCTNTVGWNCVLPECSNKDVGTTITGKVYDPAGKNPIYGAVVYIPNNLNELTAISQGPGNSCGTCEKPQGQPLAGAVTAADGSFTINKAPVGTKIPLVVQVGKWRRMTYVSATNQCGPNAITDKELTRLPRAQTDGEKASLPKIAVAVGDADRLQCLFVRMGLDPHEFTNPGGSGAINLYNLPSSMNDNSSYRGSYDSTYNSGAQFPDATALWTDLNKLAQYDVLMLACGGNQSAMDPSKTPGTISDTSKANMVSYLAHGGRVFAEHYHWTWIKSFPTGTKPTDIPIPSPLGTDVATWIPYVSSNTVPSTPALVETSFPKGKDFAEWLLTVGASSTLGTMVFDPTDTTTKPSAKDEITPGPSARRWIYQPADTANPTGAASNTHYLSFNVSSSGQVIDRLDTTSTNMCGRFVYTGLHVAAASSGAHSPDSKSSPFPSQCQAGDLSSYEKAIEFMLFDLSSCLTTDQSTVGNTIIF